MDLKMDVEGSSKLKKVKLPLRLIKINTLKIYGGVEVHLRTFLTSELAAKLLVSFMSLLTYLRGSVSGIR
jgi:hypothetical protein